MSKLHISEQLLLPKDTVTSTVIGYGGKGMGKTNFGAVLVEELNAAGLRWCSLDPLGVWWGLRYSADGSGPGIECVILGGSHADFPIEPTGGAVVADMVVDETANFIIDFSRKPSGEMWSIGEKIKFITDYAYRLFQRQGELVDGRRREPLFQLLDEAARYIPQVIPSGAAELAKCVSAWEQLVEEGRNIGIGVGLLTQRSARMNKSVSEVADAIFSFRIVGPNSIGAIMDWLGEHVPKERIKSMIETVRSLERGSCLVVSPGWLQFEGVVKIRMRETFDSSATPKPGERARKVSGQGAKPDLEKYAERMKASVERAKENDPKELKAKIAELQRELKKRPEQSPAPQAKPAAVDPRAVERAVKQATDPLIKQLATIKQTIQRVGSFDLDPCAAPSPRPWPTAKEHVALPDDGLSIDWRGRVWLNPPYHRDLIGLWLEKMSRHANGIALIFARTETAAWQLWVWPFATAILFVKGRLEFCLPDGTRVKHNSGAPSALIAYSPEDAKILRSSAIRGALVERVSLQ